MFLNFDIYECIGSSNFVRLLVIGLKGFLAYFASTYTEHFENLLTFMVDINHICLSRFMDAKLTWPKLPCYKSIDSAMQVKLKTFPFMVSKARLSTNRLSFRYPFPTKTPLWEITTLSSSTAVFNPALLRSILKIKFLRREVTYDKLLKDSNLPEVNLRRILRLPITLAVVELAM